MLTKEATEKWGMSERCIQKLYEDNRIPGGVCFSRECAIQKDEKKL